VCVFLLTMCVYMCIFTNDVCVYVSFLCVWGHTIVVTIVATIVVPVVGSIHEVTISIVTFIVGKY
jgi:hypothetical protein